MLWDDRYFYVAAQLDEPHVWGTLTKHDSVIFHDNDFEVFIDPDGDNHEYYEFEMNALNTGWDLFLKKPYRDGGPALNEWEIPGLKTGVHVRGTLNDPNDADQGWTVEIAFPWPVLKEFAHRPAPPREGDQWRVNFSRVEWRHEIKDGKYVKVPNTKEDNWVWSPQGAIDMHRPQLWGFVQFTAEPAGKSEYRPDPSWPARSDLMRIYWAQLDHREQRKTYAGDLQALGLGDLKAKGVLLKTTKDGYEAVYPLGPGRSLRIAQDSRLVVETAPDPELLTVAEKSDYQATARYDEVVALCKKLAAASPLIEYGEFGKTVEGRALPMLILAKPPLKTPEDVAKSDKLTALVYANIHAGEVCGKEALPMLAREIVANPDHPLLKDLALIFVPILNADGNERVSKTHRPHQNGPVAGMGQRENAEGLDLNRDWMKLETPEIRAMVRLFNRSDPDVVIDTHTTNGSPHRYTLTYEGPKNPAGSKAIIEHVRDVMLPASGALLENATGFRSFYYGNFEKNHQEWTSYPAEPRYSTNYQGLRHQIAVLSEAYVYASYKDRIVATREFVRACLQYASANQDRIRGLRAQAETEAGANSADVPIRTEVRPMPKPVTVAGYEEKPGQRANADGSSPPKDYQATWINQHSGALSVRRPWAYLVPPGLPQVAENLQRHGIALEELREELDLDVEAYRLEEVKASGFAFQGHKLTLVEKATARKLTKRAPAGSILVKTAQPLGHLAVLLLEPQSEDGLCAWNALDSAIKEGQDYPILRISAPLALLTTRPRDLPEEVVSAPTNAAQAPIAIRPGSGARMGFGSASGSSPTWLPDGEHYLQSRDGKTFKVEAATGRFEPYKPPAERSREPLIQALGKMPTIGPRSAQSAASRASSNPAPNGEGGLIDHGNDLYFARWDGGSVVRLTKTPERELMPTFSPDGRYAAYVRDNDLGVVDIATQSDRILTTDGDGAILNGVASYVYYEEVFNRNRKAFWWSPNSEWLAFLKFDDSGVKKLPVFDPLSFTASEAPRYPRVGDANPKVALGIVSASGGTPRLIEFPDYPDNSHLIMRVYWRPEGETAIVYVMDRIQTRLDVWEVPCGGGPPKKLLRETTPAWVEALEPPIFLKDGSFLFLSERNGYRHLYHYDKDGKLLKPITQGEFSVGDDPRIDEAAKTAVFSARREGTLDVHYYRVKLDGTGLEALTKPPGRHSATVSPNGKWFIDQVADFATPPRMYLGSLTGGPGRVIDANPSYETEGRRTPNRELVRIATEDGAILHGDLTLPPDFDPNKLYPVFFTTYGGPRFPTISNAFGGGFGNQSAMAREGYVVFRIDPRSASNLSPRSAWSAYKQLGVQELKDIEEALRWLIKTKPFVDKDRIAISGSSYGGFLVCFAMTHSKMFAAGVASAPVTDWRDYDSIYTERYMRTPAENPEGYDATSAVKAAANLHGKLLLIHGARDHNVPVQNTMKLAHALQQAGKDFEMMIYPTAAHGGFGQHSTRLSREFLKRALGGPVARPLAAPAAKPAVKQVRASE